MMCYDRSQFNTYDIIRKIEECYVRNDYNTRRMIAFIDYFLDGKIETIESLAVLAFYFEYKDNKQISAMLINGFDKKSLKTLAISLYLTEQMITEVETEFFSYFGLISQEKDLEKTKYEIINDNFDIKKNILEIGCGIFPSVAKYIDKKQTSVGQGSITCYDSKLQIKTDGNIKLVNQNIDLNTNISAYDYMYAFSACDATKPFLELASQNNKEFVLGLCTCPQVVPNDLYETIVLGQNPAIDKLYKKLPFKDKIILRSLKGVSKYDIINILDNVCPSRLYAIYIITKLMIYNDGKSEYKLLPEDEMLHSIITKKKIKKYY